MVITSEIRMIPHSDESIAGDVCKERFNVITVIMSILAALSFLTYFITNFYFKDGPVAFLNMLIILFVFTPSIMYLVISFLRFYALGTLEQINTGIKNGDREKVKQVVIAYEDYNTTHGISIGLLLSLKLSDQEITCLDINTNLIMCKNKTVKLPGPIKCIFKVTESSSIASGCEIDFNTMTIKIPTQV